MQNKKRLLAFFALPLVLPVFAFGKEKKSVKELTLESAWESNAELNRICQPFTWESAGDVLKYVITIEKLDDENNITKEVFSHETNEEETANCLIHIEPPLPPGKYRSHIKIYNILGILEEDLETSDEFIVRKAYEPEIKSVIYPLYLRQTIYLDDLDNNGIIEIEGKNLFEPDPSKNSLIYTDYFLKSEKRIIYPEEILSHDKNNKKLVFRFDMKKLNVGNYHFYAQDASGLHSEENLANKVTVKFRKWADFDLQAGYTFPVILHDNTFPKFLDSKLMPLSAQAKMSFMPFKHSWGYLGFGLRGNYSRLYSEQEKYDVDGNLGMAHLLFIYQIPTLKRRLFFELHGGAGITYFNNIYFNFSSDINSEEYNSLSPSFDAGLSSQIYINKRFYTEISADYSITLNQSMNLGIIMPSLGIGWQF